MEHMIKIDATLTLEIRSDRRSRLSLVTYRSLDLDRGQMHIVVFFRSLTRGALHFTSAR